MEVPNEENFSEYEKIILCQLILKNYGIINDKRHDVATAFKRIRCWSKIAEDFNKISKTVKRGVISRQNLWDLLKETTVEYSLSIAEEMVEAGALEFDDHGIADEPPCKIARMQNEKENSTSLKNSIPLQKKTSAGIKGPTPLRVHNGMYGSSPSGQRVFKTPSVRSAKIPPPPPELQMVQQTASRTQTSLRSNNKTCASSSLTSSTVSSRSVPEKNSSRSSAITQNPPTPKHTSQQLPTSNAEWESYKKMKTDKINLNILLTQMKKNQIELKILELDYQLKQKVLTKPNKKS